MYTIKQNPTVRTLYRLFICRKKTAIVFAFAIVVMLSGIVVSGLNRLALAAPTDDSCFTFNSGTGTITDYTPNGTTCPLDVEIPSTIGGAGVVIIGDSAFENKGLTGVTMPNSITSIGNYAFKDNDISSASFSTALTGIGTEAFINNELTNVSIPNTVTGIGMFAFYNNQLASVSISNSLVVLSSRVFGENQLTSVNIPSSVTTIQDGAFERNQIASVTMPSSVTYIGEDAFAVNFLTHLVIPDSVIFIGEMAFHGNMLSSVELGSSVDTIGNLAFSYNRIDSVTLPSSLTSLGQNVFHIQCLYHVNDFPGGDPEDMYPTFWLAQVFTEDPSNPLGLTDEIRYESYFSSDFNSDGDLDDIITGHLINPTQATVTYKDSKGNNLLPPLVLMGSGLESRLAVDNTTNDPNLYYRVGGSDTFVAPNITGYVTPGSQNKTFVLGVNTVNFVYTTSNNTNEPDDNEQEETDTANDTPSGTGELTNTGTPIQFVLPTASFVLAATIMLGLYSRRIMRIYRFRR